MSNGENILKRIRALFGVPNKAHFRLHRQYTSFRKNFAAALFKLFHSASRPALCIPSITKSDIKQFERLQNVFILIPIVVLVIQCSNCIAFRGSKMTKINICCISLGCERRNIKFIIVVDVISIKAFISQL